MQHPEWIAIADLFTGLLIAGLSVPLMLGKVPSNRWYGFVFSKALESERQWLLVNRYGAKRMLCWALAWASIGLAALLVPTDAGSFWPWALVLAPPVLFLIPVLQAHRFSRNVPPV